jgi:hypothetical protein
MRRVSERQVNRLFRVGDGTLTRRSTQRSQLTRSLGCIEYVICRIDLGGDRVGTRHRRHVDVFMKCFRSESSLVVAPWPDSDG